MGEAKEWPTHSSLPKTIKSGIPIRFNAESHNQIAMKMMRVPSTDCIFVPNKKGIVFYFPGCLPKEEPPGCVPYLKKSRQGAFLT
jgi:hypothetical protein